jgi:hypothetical protein
MSREKELEEQRDFILGILEDALQEAQFCVEDSLKFQSGTLECEEYLQDILDAKTIIKVWCDRLKGAIDHRNF